MAQSSLPHPPGRALERAFELTSVAPLAVLAVLHVADYGRVLLGVESVGARRAPPAFLIGAEALFVWLPLAFHALYGVRVWLERRARETPAPGAVGLLALHRLTGAAAGLFLIEHFVRFRLPILRGEEYPSDAVQRLAAELSSTRGGVPLVGVAELFGVLAVAYHLGYGLYRVAVRRAGTNGPRAARIAATVVGVLVGLVAAATILELSGG